MSLFVPPQAYSEVCIWHCLRVTIPCKGRTLLLILWQLAA